jgi:hypothetical protein
MTRRAARLAVGALAVVVMLLAPAGRAEPSAGRTCATLTGIRWTSTFQGHVTHGRRYRVTAERLPCVVAVRLAAQLIPLRTSAAFAENRPVGYVCIPLGTGANRFRPATALGLCLQKPISSTPSRSFSWHPV